MRLVLLSLLVIFLLGMTYQTRNHPQIRNNKLLDRIQHPFDTRLRYRIAEVDPRFGLSENELKQISQQAIRLTSHAVIDNELSDTRRSNSKQDRQHNESHHQLDERHTTIQEKSIAITAIRSTRNKTSTHQFSPENKD